MDSFSLPIDVKFRLELQLDLARIEAQKQLDDYFGKNGEYIKMQAVQFAESLCRSYMKEGIQQEVDRLMRSAIVDVVDLEVIKRAAKKARAKIAKELLTEMDKQIL